MEKINEIRQALMESYNTSFNLKATIGSIFSGIEILILMIDEDPEVFLSQFDERDIQMYNYLLNEIIMELRKRSTERLNAEKIVRNVVNIRNTRPITVQVDHIDWNPRIVVPNFEIPEDLVWPNLAPLSVESATMDQKNRTPNFNLRAIDHYPTLAKSNAPNIPPRSEIMNERTLDITLRKGSIHQSTSESTDKKIVSSISEEQLFRNLVEVEELPVDPPLLADVIRGEQRDLDLQTSDAVRFGTMPKTSEIQQFENLVDVEEALINLPDSLPPLRRIDLPSVKELSSKQRVQFDELEINVPDIPPDDNFIQEFKELFERRRKEKAAIDYAARASLRTIRSSTGLNYRDFSRSIAHLRPISEEVHTLRVLPLFPQTSSLNISKQIQYLLISSSNQEWHHRSLTDRSLHMEFSNLIMHKPQSTPETSYSGKQKPKKWTSVLPVLEEDQIDVQRTSEVLGDQDKVITESIFIESHQTPLTAKNVQREITGWKLAGSKSPLPVLQDEIEPPPAVETTIQDPIIVTQSPEMVVQENIQNHLKTYSNVTTTESDRLIFRQRPSKRPKLTTEKAHPATEVQNLTEDTAFKQYLKSWKNSFLILNANDKHHDVHFPVDLLNMFDFATPVHQILKKIVSSGDNPFNYFVPPTSTRKEAAKRIHILLELRTQNILDFIVQDGDVTGICIK